MSKITDSNNVMQARDIQSLSTGQKVRAMLAKAGTYLFLLIMALILGDGLSLKAIILLPILFAACMLGIGMGKKRGAHRFAIK